MIEAIPINFLNITATVWIHKGFNYHVKIIPVDRPGVQGGTAFSRPMQCSPGCRLGAIAPKMKTDLGFYLNMLKQPFEYR
ncbi:unnamed protein product [Rhizophagus irregularis]|nr:unnamed protein product [Rhizophagus irregularis]